MSDAVFFALLMVIACGIAVGSFALGRQSTRRPVVIASTMFVDLPTARPVSVPIAVATVRTVAPLEMMHDRTLEQALLDENADLREQNARLTDQAATKDRLRRRYLHSSNNLRKRLKVRVPLDEFVQEVSLRSRGVAVARAAAGRAAAVSGCLDAIADAVHLAAEVDLPWHLFNAEMDEILGRVPAHV